MNVLDLPFNSLLGFERCDDTEQLLALNFDSRLLNHLGNIHASALFALAEASSGEFLIRHRGERVDIGGVVRRANSKYSAPANSRVIATSLTDRSSVAEAISMVDVKGRALTTIEIEIKAVDGSLIGRFGFDWLLAKV
ncbi:MAG: acyl-coenzyme A thioesterase PaaI-like protein [Verrucomicrobiales bacterium]|jgi:acyl-coenzyme A thioesterase PaaI-like protein